MSSVAVAAPVPLTRPTVSRRALHLTGRVLRTAVLALVALIAIGNIVIFVSYRAAHTGETALGEELGLMNFRQVDDQVWRGAFPHAAGYAGLAERGVTTIVDLRAESTAEERASAEALGLNVVWLPIRDGQLPGRSQINTFVATVDNSDGTVYVHCAAGVGRTGSMIAAWSIETGRLTAYDAVGDMLSVGPPSLEQLTFAAQYDSRRPNGAVTTVSRIIDGPRRIMARLGI